MVEGGNRPIIAHIMPSYAAHGIADFVRCCGYKGEVLREYFLNRSRLQGDFAVDLDTGDVTMHRFAAEPWRVTSVDTGLKTMTGGRLRRVRPYIGEETISLTVSIRCTRVWRRGWGGGRGQVGSVRMRRQLRCRGWR